MINIERQKLIIFDFDGTLCDSMQQVIDSYNALTPYYNTIPIQEKEIENLRNTSLQYFLEAHGVKKWKLPFMKYHLAQTIKPFISSMNSFPGIREMLIELKNHGYKLGILTSNSYANVALFLDKEKIAVFDFVYCGSSIFGKARILKKIVSRTKLSPIFYVGDENRDIEAAYQANISSIAVTWGYQSKFLLSSYYPSYLIQSPAELLSVFGH